jgi:hypothetical protein
MVAAPDKDPKLASARFKVAELHLKEDRLSDADYLYQNPVVRESELAARAAERVKEIQAIKARLEEGKKLIAKSPDKAVAALTALAAERPKYADALAALEEARDALAAANRRPVAKRTVKKPPVVSKLKAALTKPPAAKAPAPAKAPEKAAEKAPAPKTPAEACGPIWKTEGNNGELTADMMFAKVKFGCDALRQQVDDCKIARDEVMALQGVPPEARVTMQLEIDPDWTLSKQIEQDDRARKNYETRNCAALLKSLAN